MSEFEDCDIENDEDVDIDEDDEKEDRDGTFRIILSDRRPVRIKEADWPVVSEAYDDYPMMCEDCEKDSEEPTSFFGIRVLQHKDGRIIVHALYRYDPPVVRWKDPKEERHYFIAHGELLGANDDVFKAIKRVVNRMSNAEHYGDHAQRWMQLGDDCVADFPEEEI